MPKFKIGDHVRYKNNREFGDDFLSLSGKIVNIKKSKFFVDKYFSEIISIKVEKLPESFSSFLTPYEVRMKIIKAFASEIELCVYIDPLEEL